MRQSETAVSLPDTNLYVLWHLKIDQTLLQINFNMHLFGGIFCCHFLFSHHLVSFYYYYYYFKYFYFLQFSLCLLYIEVLNCDSFMIFCFFPPAAGAIWLAGWCLNVCPQVILHLWVLPAPLSLPAYSWSICPRMHSCCTVPRLFLRNTASLCRSGHFDPLGALPWRQV